MLEKLVKLALETQKIDSEIKEMRESEKSVTKTKKFGLEVAKIDGFYEKLAVKMDAAVQRKMELFDEKSEILDKIIRNLMDMSSETPTSQTFEEDSQIVSDFCNELKHFLRSNRMENCPIITLPVEKAVKRIVADSSADT